MHFEKASEQGRTIPFLPINRYFPTHYQIADADT